MSAGSRLVERPCTEALLFKREDRFRVQSRELSRLDEDWFTGFFHSSRLSRFYRVFAIGRRRARRLQGDCKDCTHRQPAIFAIFVRWSTTESTSELNDRANGWVINRRMMQPFPVWIAALAAGDPRVYRCMRETAIKHFLGWRSVMESLPKSAKPCRIVPHAAARRESHPRSANRTRLPAYVMNRGASLSAAGHSAWPFADRVARSQPACMTSAAAATLNTPSQRPALLFVMILEVRQPWPKRAKAK